MTTSGPCNLRATVGNTTSSQLPSSGAVWDGGICGIASARGWGTPLPVLSFFVRFGPVDPARVRGDGVLFLLGDTAPIRGDLGVEAAGGLS